MKQLLKTLSKEELTLEEFRKQGDLTEDEAKEVIDFLHQKGFIIDTEWHGKTRIQAAEDLELLVNAGKEEELEKIEEEIKLILDQDIKQKEKGYSAIEVIEENTFIVSGLLRSVGIQISNNEDFIYETDYRIWKCESDKKGIDFFLFTNPDKHQDIKEGEQKMATTQVEPHELDNWKRPNMTDNAIEKLFDIKDIENDKSGWDKVKWALSNHLIEIRKPINPLKEEQKEKVVQNIDIQDAIDLSIRNDQNLDDDIKYVFRAMRVNFNDGVIDHEYVMPYNPHTLMVTNTKVGKSTTAEHIGWKIDDASSAGLLGFSSSDETNYGDLHGELGMVAFDEIEKSDNKFLDKLPTFLERGKVSISKGQQVVKTRGSPTVMAFANPYVNKQSGTDDGEGLENYGDGIDMQRLMESFDEVLNRISSGSSYQALGSRFGVVVFGNDYDTARKDHNVELTSEELRKNRTIVESMFDHCKKKIRQLFHNAVVQEWLSESMPDYEKEIDKNLQGKSNLMPAVRDFWEGNKKAYQGIRGFALKQAIIDHIEEIWLDDDFNYRDYVEDILDDAEKHLQKAIRINLQSLQNMGEVENTTKDILVRRFNGLPNYQANLILGLASLCSENREYIGEERISDDELNNHYNQMPDGHKKGRLEAFWKVKTSIPDSAGKVSSKLEDMFNVRILDVSDGYEFEVQNDDILYIAEEVLGKAGESDGEEHNEYDSVKNYIQEEGPVHEQDIVDRFGAKAEDELENLSHRGEIYEVGGGKWDVV